ncbi:MAG: hypothetical protein LQ337_001332 [Flavoplaca oasis]|nr:MAG: hypothetical protein LQ337_001332 [Flavoplaca oasis]
MAPSQPNRSLPKAAAPNPTSILPHFSFRFSDVEVENLNFIKGLGRMVMLAKARHELEVNGQRTGSAALTQLIQRFQANFTLEWEGDVDDMDVEDEDEDDSDDSDDDGGSQKEKSPPNQDDRLLKCLDSIVSACRQLRSMGIEPPSVFQSMMSMIIAVLKGLTDDKTRFKEWLEKNSALDKKTISMMSSA